jgi:two-component system, NarL family, response regulator NreC
MLIRILIADDHSFIRTGLRTILQSQPDVQVVGEAADALEAIQLAQELKPDVLLTDISMPGLTGGGIEVTRRLQTLVPDVAVLILTVHEDETLLREAIQAGASGYVVKRAAEAELISAVQAVARGDMYIHPAMTRMLLAGLAAPKAPPSVAVESLTQREIDVLRLLAKGYTNRQIADALSVSVRTVEGHRANLMDKLNAHSRVELTSVAEEMGLLP